MYPNAYIEFLAHFHGDRDYFECHEILEEYWKLVDCGNKDSIWVGFIQLAVSSYHHRRGNFQGAKRTLQKAWKVFTLKKDSLLELGLDPQLLISLVQDRLWMIEEKTIYKSMDLPINDSILLAECKKTAETLGFQWGSVSDLSDAELVHRHKWRDRTSVIEERNHALKIRKGNKFIN